MKQYFSILTALILISGVLKAQVSDPVKWQLGYKYNPDNSVEINFNASIQGKWHMYGAFFPEGGPVATTFHFDTSKYFKLSGAIKEVTPPERKKDPNFDNMEITLHNGKAVFAQKIICKTSGPFTIKGFIEYMTCNDQTCLPPKQKQFAVLVTPKISENNTQKNVIGQKTDSAKPMTSISPKAKTEKLQTDSKDNSLWSFFLLAFIAGLAGTVTPCVFPMIPMTVTFFMRGSENRVRAIVKGSIFGISIMLIYTLVGVLVSLTSLGSGFANQLSTHWAPNLLFFLLFLIFAASFLGMFEIVLPGSIVNRADQHADKGGYFGIVFMALATVLVSFSCTGPIVGALLVEAAGGLAMKPILGMFGFGLAFALPFTFFAIFPSSLKSLPKSGGWLNSVKIVLGLIVLAFSLKFLVNIDQAYHFNIISREIFLAIWIAISLILGLYLLGKIKFIHDSDVKYVSVPRLMLVIVTFTFAIYLFTGFFGNNLTSINSMLPPASEKISISSESQNEGQGQALCGIPKYSDFLHLPFGLKGYFELKEALACSKQIGKPVFIDFKGHACSNCKKMEATVFSKPEIQKLLQENFIVVALYADDRTGLAEKDWRKSDTDGEIKKTMGMVNESLEIDLFKTNALPLYAIVDSFGKPIVSPIGTELNPEKFKSFLESAISKSQKSIRLI